MVELPEIRNIQKTGNMHYIYLPTSWCKKYKINSDSKVAIELKNDSTLIISPQLKEKKLKEINITISEINQDIITKLIIACYINPTKSFKIKLEKETDVAKLLDQKRLISALEFVELDGNNITYESSMSISDPDVLLKTMVKKIKNLVASMINDYNKKLINKYEEEIDRSKLLIEKSVIGALSLNQPIKKTIIELHYTATISKDLERMVDSLILVDKSEKTFLKKILKIIENIKDLLENPKNLDYKTAIELDRNIMGLKSPEIENIKTYGKRRIKRNLISISEVFFDWAITKEITK